MHIRTQISLMVLALVTTLTIISTNAQQKDAQQNTQKEKSPTQRVKDEQPRAEKSDASQNETNTRINAPVTVQGTIETIDKPTAADEERDRREKDALRWNKATAVLAGLATLFAAGAFIAAMRQANAASGALRESQRAAQENEKVVRLTERADVLLDGINFNFGEVFGGGYATVKLFFKNFGRTRAVDVELRAQLRIPDTPVSDPGVLGPIILGPGDSQSIEFQRFREWMPEESAGGVFSGTVPLTFDAVVTYRDVFGYPHTSRATGTFDHETMTFRIGTHAAD